MTYAEIMTKLEEIETELANKALAAVLDAKRGEAAACRRTADRVFEAQQALYILKRQEEMASR
jgi:hypothetical protein